MFARSSEFVQPQPLQRPKRAPVRRIARLSRLEQPRLDRAGAELELVLLLELVGDGLEVGELRGVVEGERAAAAARDEGEEEKEEGAGEEDGEDGGGDVDGGADVAHEK